MLDPNWKSKMIDGGGLHLYLQGMSLLYQSGVLDVLEFLGHPVIIKDGADVNVMATQAARSAGFYDALVSLVKFKELYLDPKVEELPKPDFGALDYLISSGTITEKEANELRSGVSAKT